VLLLHACALKKTSRLGKGPGSRGFAGQCRREIKPSRVGAWNLKGPLN